MALQDTPQGQAGGLGAWPVDVPVAVACSEPLHSQLSVWLEGDVGWQVVSGSGPLQPVAWLVDDPAQVRRRPAAVLVSSDEASLDALVWPAQRDHVLEAVLAAGSRGAARSGSNGRTGRRLLGIGGAAGGVGTSTVAWTVAAWSAWAGARTLLIGADDLLCLAGLGAWEGPSVEELARVGVDEVAAEVARAGVPAPGAPGLTVLGGAGDPAALTVVADAADADVVVADLRTSVCRTLGPRPAAVVALADARALRCGVDPGDLVVRVPAPLSTSEARRALGAPPRGWVPDDVRVRRAGLTGRLPGALPGRWVRATCAAVAGAEGARRRGGRRAEQWSRRLRGARSIR